MILIVIVIIFYAEAKRIWDSDNNKIKIEINRMFQVENDSEQFQNFKSA